MKVEVDFPADFESNAVLPIHLGRLTLGPHVIRLILCPDGKMRMLANKQAVEDGYIKLRQIDDEEVVLRGFGAVK